jgi:hypothetical protein
VTPEALSTQIAEAWHHLGFESGAYYDIVAIRDDVCQSLQLSDQDFGLLLLKVAHDADRQIHPIDVGVGPLVSPVPMGYATKLATLPAFFEGEPITKILVRT